MNGYYLFSDESGSYEENRSEGFVNKHPYYVRSSVLINFEDYIYLENKSIEYKEKLGIDKQKEVKWSDIGKYKSGRPGYNKEELLLLQKYIFFMIFEMSNQKSVRLFFSVFDNGTKRKIQYENLLKMHLQNALQRAQKDVNENDYVTMIIDEIERRHIKSLKNIIHELLLKGDFVDYNNINKSILIDYSNHSTGLQLADYCVGIINSSLIRIEEPNNYQFAHYLLENFMFKKIRCCENGPFEVYGYGIHEVPNGCGDKACKQLSEYIMELITDDFINN